MQASIKDYNFRNVFKTERNQLDFLGLYPANKYKLVTWKTFKMVITVSASALLCLLMLCQMYFGDLEQLIDPSILYVSHTAFCFKLALFNYRGDTMKKIEDTLEDPKSYTFSADVLKHVVDSMKRSRMVGKTYRSLITVYVSLLIVTMTINYKSRTLPVSGWFPFDIIKSTYYCFTFIAEVICLATSGYSHTSIDIINFLLLSITSCQFDILLDNLKNIDYSSEAALVRKELKRNVEFHLEILKLFKMINKMYSHIAFIQCVTSAIVICLAGFQIIVSCPSPFQFCMLLVYLLGLFIQSGFYCWYGHDVIVKSSNVRDACYMTNWYESDIETRKMLLIIMERSKRPLQFAAGGFFILSLSAFTNILKSSYSYFALLQHMYST